MRTKILSFLIAAAGGIFIAAPSPCISADEDDSLAITTAQIFEETMQVPEKAVPQYLLNSCRCIAIFPNTGLAIVSKMALGLVTCRSPKTQDWSTPAIAMLSKWGHGDAGSSLILLGMTEKAENLLTKKYWKLPKVGSKIGTAPGTLNWEAPPNSQLVATDIVAWAKNSGIISGVDISGAYLGQLKRPPRVFAPAGDGLPKDPSRDKCLRLLGAIEKYASNAP